MKSRYLDPNLRIFYLAVWVELKTLHFKFLVGSGLFENGEKCGSPEDTEVIVSASEFLRKVKCQGSTLLWTFKSNDTFTLQVFYEEIYLPNITKVVCHMY